MDPTLVIFFGLAAFMTYKLFSVLGTRGGHEPTEDQDPLRDLRQHQAAQDEEDEPRAPAAVTPQTPDSAAPDWVRTVRSSYPAFEPARFVDGAKSAYEMIVQAFASGNLGDVRPYVDAQVMQAFETAVSARQKTGQTMEVTFVGIEKADVETAVDRDGLVAVTLAFQSDQIRVVRDADGEIIEGDPNRIDLVKDRWTFARPTNSTDPNWMLVATDGAAPAAA